MNDLPGVHAPWNHAHYLKLFICTKFENLKHIFKATGSVKATVLQGQTHPLRHAQVLIFLCRCPLTFLASEKISDGGAESVTPAVCLVIHTEAGR